jgi:hypothetical protein
MDVAWSGSAGRSVVEVRRLAQAAGPALQIDVPQGNADDEGSLPGARVNPRILLALALFLSSGAAVPKTSECDNDCEASYKVCLQSGKMTNRSCLAEREKCRKVCIKKEKNEIVK